jgi:peroxiredoxin
MYNKEYNMFMCNFPQYATTEYKGKKIAICSSDFTDLSYSTIGLAIIKDDMKKGEKVERNHVYRKNEYIEIGDGNYKVVEVNTFKNKLILERTDLPKSQLISSQVGYRPFPFEKESFQQKTTIALEKLKGKYVLLDFWAVWCGACLAEIPNLKKLYANVDKSKFEMIGIVGDSPAESLKELIDKHGITWPQILLDNTDQIKKGYGINGYPTTFLLNKEGVIIATNLRGKELEEKILNLIKE